MFTPFACCWSQGTSRDTNSLPFCQLQVFSWFSVINGSNMSLLGFLWVLSLCFPMHFFLIWRPYMDKVLEITVITQFLFVYYVLVGGFSLFCIIWLLFTVQFPTHSACSHCSRPFVHLSAQLKKMLIKLPVIFKPEFLWNSTIKSPWPLGFTRVISCHLWTWKNPKLLLLKEHHGVKPTHLLVFNSVQSQGLSLCTSFWKYGFK